MEIIGVEICFGVISAKLINISRFSIDMNGLHRKNRRIEHDAGFDQNTTNGAFGMAEITIRGV